MRVRYRTASGSDRIIILSAYLGRSGRYRSRFCNVNYAVNEEPQPQLPVAFGFVNVKPEPITLVT